MCQLQKCLFKVFLLVPREISWKLNFNFNRYFQRPQWSFFVLTTHTLLFSWDGFVFSSFVCIRSITKKPVILRDQAWLSNSFPRTSRKMEPIEKKKGNVSLWTNLIENNLSSPKSSTVLVVNFPSCHTVKLQIPDEVTWLSVTKSHKTVWPGVTEYLKIAWPSVMEMSKTTWRKCQNRHVTLMYQRHKANLPISFCKWMMSKKMSMHRENLQIKY